MTSSSSAPTLTQGLDTMLLLSSLLQGHPASTPCEQFLRNRSGWFTSPLVLLETRAVLVKVYGVDAAQATQSLTQLAQGPLTVLDLTPTDTLAALTLADLHHLDLTDAMLLQQTIASGAKELATDDQHLAQICISLGLTTSSPITAVLRQQIDAWEKIHLVAKGLNRILRRVHDWLGSLHPQAAQDFWSQTGGGIHLP
jgi:predicted nucleic acid-binding protein